MGKLLRLALFAGILLLPLVTPAEATSLLLSQTVQTTYLFPNTGTVLFAAVNSVVGAGVELTNYANFVNIDFSDTNILITTTRIAGVNNVSFDGLEFFDVNGTIPAFTSVSLNAATTYAGITASRIAFDADHIFVNVANLQGLNGQTISLDINASAAVPEPSSLFLLGAGLTVLGCGWQRRKHVTLRDKHRPGKTQGAIE